MRYTVCKSFEVESGHMLSKHPGRCRYPHGHSRRVDVVISSEVLDENDMVCDFKAVKLAVGAFVDRFDHALVVNSEDPELVRLREGPAGGRLVEVVGEDPTTEVLARLIFEHVERSLGSGERYTDLDGVSFGFPAGLRLESVRVTETSSSWAEYGR
ncbi:MAG: 6-carboxytetrahydropterin synthase [Planctomycetota bacterium]